jgi:hypothetical protein
VQVAEWNDAVSGAIQIFAQDGTFTLLEAGPARQTLPPGYIVDDIEIAGAVHRHPVTSKSNT